MKRYLFGVCIFAFCGCSALPGYLQAQHNGLYYWFLQGCEHYRYSYGDPNTLYCVDENQNLTGVVLQPASQEEIQTYLYRRELEAQAYERSLQNFNQSMQNLANSYEQSSAHMRQLSNDMANFNHMQNIDRSLRGIDNSLNKMANPYSYGIYRP